MQNYSARVLIVLLLAFSSASCMSWSRLGPSPERAIRSVPAPKLLRVTNKDGSRLMLTKLQIRGDSLWYAKAGVYASMPISQITAVDVQTINAARAAAILAGGLAAALLYGAISFSNSF